MVLENGFRIASLMYQLPAMFSSRPCRWCVKDLSITTDDAEVYHLDLIGRLVHSDRKVATLRQHHLFDRSDFTLFNSKLLYVMFGNALSCRVCLSSTSVERTGRMRSRCYIAYLHEICISQIRIPRIPLRF